MNRHAGISIIVALFIVVLMITAVMAVFFLPLGSGYKVTVVGSASYGGLWPFYDWTLSFGGATHEEDIYLFATQPGLGWIWESGGVYIEVILGEKRAEKQIGSFGSWFPGDPKVWSIDLRHVEPGYYTGTINLYELKGDLFGIGGHKELRKTVTFVYDLQ